MTEPQTHSGDLRGAHFREASLHGARFEEVDLGEVVARGVNLDGADLDDPFLCGGESSLLIDGIDVVPFVEAELNRRFPGREQRRATAPEALRTAWASLEGSWSATLERVRAMPDGTADASVAGEWSFAQTLRHLVLATDMWLGKAILDREDPFHPLGLLDRATAADGTTLDGGHQTPSYAEVLEARAGRVAMVRAFLDTVTPEQLAQARPNPHDPQHAETVLSCLHTILEEEWEHLRFAHRDLDALRAADTA